MCVFSRAYSCAVLPIPVLPRWGLSEKQQKRLSIGLLLYYSILPFLPFFLHISRLYFLKHERVTPKHTQPCMCFSVLPLSHSMHRSCEQSLTTPGEVSIVSLCPLYCIYLRVDSKPERTSLWKQTTFSRRIKTEPGITLGTLKLAPWNKSHCCEKQSSGDEAEPETEMNCKEESPSVSLKAWC